MSAKFSPEILSAFGSEHPLHTSARRVTFKAKSATSQPCTASSVTPNRSRMVGMDCRSSSHLVRFDQTKVWKPYADSPKDTLLIDIYEHWLEPV